MPWNDGLSTSVATVGKKVVIGNAGVVRVLKTGSNVSSLKAGDVCIVFCNGIWDEYGFPERILATTLRTQSACSLKE